MMAVKAAHEQRAHDGADAANGEQQAEDLLVATEQIGKHGHDLHVGVAEEHADEGRRQQPQEKRVVPDVVHPLPQLLPRRLGGNRWHSHRQGQDDPEHGQKAERCQRKHEARIKPGDQQAAQRRDRHARGLPDERVERDRAHHRSAFNEVGIDRHSRRPIQTGDKREQRRDQEHVPDRHHAGEDQRGQNGEQRGARSGGHDQNLALVEPVGDDPTGQRHGDVRQRGSDPEVTQLKR